jgi:tRNA A-37 threonylcarbamoyl transferase component Bud32
MALQDKFGKKVTEPNPAKVGPAKSTTPRVVSVNLPPTLEDLRFSCDRARAQKASPSALSWRAGSETYILTATVAEGAYDPTWILSAGGESKSVVVWTYTCSDPELIFSFLYPNNDGSVQAVIPESLRPKTPEEEAAEAELPSEEFSDKVEILSRVGFGGMGVIYKARRKDNQEIVALKVLHGHLLEDSEITARFMQEASACLELRHRNLITVQEYGVSKRGKPFMIMEYLEGKALTDIIQEKGRLETSQFINIFTQICDGLQCAHECNVVHRDVKPSNIMIITTEGGWEWAKLLDFGIAKEIIESQTKLTPTGNVVGSPAYISPEQCAGYKADPSNDVYSLGCVMYEALAGRPPFLHESPIKILLMHLEDLPPRLASVCPEGTVIPEDIEAVIMRCLEKDPARRYSSAAELSVELWAIAAKKSYSALDPVEPVQTVPTAPGNASISAAAYPSADAGYGAVDPAAYPVAGMSQQNYEPSAAYAEAAAAELPGIVADYLQANETSAQSAYQNAESASHIPVLTVRLSRCRTAAEMDGVWEGLLLAERIQGRGMTVGILLETESVLLVMRPDPERFNLDEQAQKRLTTLQTKMRQLIKSGASVSASGRWVTRGTTAQATMPGVRLLNDDQICDLLIGCRGTILDY